MESAAWNILPYLSREQILFYERSGVNRYIAQLLVNRGIKNAGEMQLFLDTRYENTGDPTTIIDMPRAVERILRALEQREHITVYGDYDADGVTSAAVLYLALKNLQHGSGGPLDYYIPNRFREGLGLHTSTIDTLHRRGTRLIITTDCASSDVEQVNYANSLGIDVIITDHHHPSDPLPQAYALVNPWRQDTQGSERHAKRALSGAGVAFKLVQSLYRAIGNYSLEDEQELLDLVAIGTVADVAPLIGDNHTFVKLGLQRLNETRNPGLQTLIACADLRRRGPLRERDISFGLAPRINAAGRLKDASLAFRLLTTEDAHEASSLAQELEALNTRRKHLTEQLMQEARIQADQQKHHRIVLVGGENWHEGIIGLVAGKLAEALNKPVIAVSLMPDPLDHTKILAKGSARSRSGFDMIAAFTTFDRFEHYGGHTQAAGFTLQSRWLPDLHQHLLSSILMFR